MRSRDRDLEAATATALRTCGCAHRYQPKQHTMHNRTGRSQSASRSSPTAAFSLSRPTTPSSMSQSAFSPLTEELRSLSEPHLDLYHDSSVARSTTSERASRPRATHWSRRTPEELARLARLRRSSRSPVSHYDSPGSHPGSHPGSRPGSRAGSRSGPRPSVGTGYGHSYSLPRPFDTAPTGCGRPAVAQQPQQGWVAVSSRFERARATSTAASTATAQSGAKLERSRTPSQSGATYYRSRSRNGMAGDSCSSCNSGWVSNVEKHTTNSTVYSAH